MPFEKDDENINRTGRRRGIKYKDIDSEQFLQALRANSVSALHTLVTIMQNDKSSDKDRISCAVKILDKSFEVHLKNPHLTKPEEVEEKDTEEEEEVHFSVKSVKK